MKILCTKNNTASFTYLSLLVVSLNSIEKSTGICQSGESEYWSEVSTRVHKQRCVCTTLQPSEVSPERAELSAERAELSLERAALSAERADLSPERAELVFEGGEVCLQVLDVTSDLSYQLDDSFFR